MCNWAKDAWLNFSFILWTGFHFCSGCRGLGAKVFTEICFTSRIFYDSAFCACAFACHCVLSYECRYCPIYIRALFIVVYSTLCARRDRSPTSIFWAFQQFACLLNDFSFIFAILFRLHLHAGAIWFCKSIFKAL